MRINSVITKMQASEKAYGCSLTFPSTAVVELKDKRVWTTFPSTPNMVPLHRMTSAVRLLLSEPPRLLG